VIKLWDGPSAMRSGKILMVLAGWVTVFAIWNRLSLGVVLVAGLFGTAGELLRRRGRRMMVPRAEETQERDPRAPVILLRSFADDYQWPQAASRPNTSSVLLTNYVSPDDVSFEQLLCEALARTGPILAIGLPGERLPPPGAAARYYVPPTEDWKDQVRTYLRSCAHVVMVVGEIKGDGGNKDGLAWELETVLGTVPPEKIAFVLPPVSGYDAYSRWAKFHERSGGRLPPYEPGLLAVAFDADWKCRVVCESGEGHPLGREYRRGLSVLSGGGSSRATEYHDKLTDRLVTRAISGAGDCPVGPTARTGPPVARREVETPGSDDEREPCPECGFRFLKFVGSCPKCNPRR
jgi:hypothetical protein